jgi:hypothetical protein
MGDGNDGGLEEDSRTPQVNVLRLPENNNAGCAPALSGCG